MSSDLNNVDSGHMQTIDYLQDVIARQIEKVKSYDIDGAMKLGEEANSLAENINRQKLFDMPQFSNKRKEVDALYSNLGLVINSQRSEIAEKLRQIGKAKKTLGAYKKSI